MLKKATQGMDGVVITHFDGLVVDYARKNNLGVIIRGFEDGFRL